MRFDQCHGTFRARDGHDKTREACAGTDIRDGTVGQMRSEKERLTVMTLDRLFQAVRMLSSL